MDQKELARAPWTSENNEYLAAERRKHLLVDATAISLRRLKPIAYIYNKTKSQFIAKHLCKIFDFSIYYIMTKQECSPYKEVLDDIVININNILISEKNLPTPLSISHMDINGYGIFNASASPWFGTNTLLVNSGIFWFSHIIARSVDPIIREAFTGNRHWHPRKHYLKKFSNTCIALITNDHTKSFSAFHFIYDPDSITNGLELFVVAHEYAHLLLNDEYFKSSIFYSYFSENIVNIISENEEVAADALSLVILNIYSKNNNDPLCLYSPILLFQLLSQLEGCGLEKTLSTHPPNEHRADYLRLMVVQLRPDFNFKAMDFAIISLFNKTKCQILAGVKKSIKDLNSTTSAIICAQDAMKSRGYQPTWPIQQ